MGSAAKLYKHIACLRSHFKRNNDDRKNSRNWQEEGRRSPVKTHRGTSLSLPEPAEVPFRAIDCPEKIVIQQRFTRRPPFLLSPFYKLISDVQKNKTIPLYMTIANITLFAKSDKYIFCHWISLLTRALEIRATHYHSDLDLPKTDFFFSSKNKTPSDVTL